MKGNLLRLGGAVWLLLAVLAPALAGADRKRPAPPPAITKLAWLAGNWRMELNGRIVDEQWMAPGGGVMLGMTRTVMKGRLMEHGFRQIRGGPGGALFYVMRLTGQNEALFQATTLTDTEAVFSNPQQEFPQTISYTLKPDGTLQVAVEGTEPDGQIKRSEITYRHFPP